MSLRDGQPTLRGSTSAIVTRDFSSPKSPDRFRDQYDLLLNGYSGFFLLR